MSGPYDDMLYLPHPVSATRPQMPAIDRAAQFSPFAALTGHSAAIEETARLTSARIELEEDCKAALSIKLNLLEEFTAQHPDISVTYFQPDERKDGGAYITASAPFKKVDPVARILVMENGEKICIEDILDIDGEWFRAFL